MIKSSPLSEFKTTNLFILEYPFKDFRPLQYPLIKMKTLK